MAKSASRPINRIWPKVCSASDMRNKRIVSLPSGGWGRLLTLTDEWNNTSASQSLHEYYFTADKALAARFSEHSVSQAWQLRWAGHLNPLAHILLALPYLGLTAAEGNKVCQERIKLEPKPTLLFKSTSQVPTSLLIAKLTMSNTNKPANSIMAPLLWDSPGKRDFVNRFPYNSTQSSSSWKSALYS